MKPILTEIEFLRNNKTPDEIESLLLNGELGEIGMDGHGYQFIGNVRLSWLVVETHKPGFIEYMNDHKYEYVVHHVDGNPLNDSYRNLKVMKLAEHVRMHRIDPRYAEFEKDRIKKQSNWYKDETNAEAVRFMYEKSSESLLIYYRNPENARAIKAKIEKGSKTVRKTWPDLKTFKQFFTAKEYAKAGRVSVDTAKHRLIILLEERQITRGKQLIDGSLCNIYRRNLCSPC